MPVDNPTPAVNQIQVLIDFLNLAAANIAFAPTGNLASLNLQDAIAELDNKTPWLPTGTMIDYEGAIDANGILIENNLVWLLLDGGTIGSAGSGASRYANAKALNLYQKLWSNTNLAIFTSAGAASTRGATVQADFDAAKRLALPDPRGRVVIPSGTGSGLTARTRGANGGSETHTLTTAQLPAHDHQLRMHRSVRQAAGYGLTQIASFQDGPMVGTGALFQSNEESYTSSIGSGQSHNNMQPFYVSGAKLILVGRN